jgi:hypothetical protein
MPKTARHVQVIGLEGWSVTERAREVVERAGYKPEVRTVSLSDLASVKAEFGGGRLPLVRTGSQTLEGMAQIRAHFPSKG